MISTLKITIVTTVVTLAISSSALATKCLRTTTVEELKNDFPVAFEGVVVGRFKAEGAGDDYNVIIEIKKFLKGEVQEKQLTIVERHVKRKISSYNMYVTGGKYVFVMDRKKKDGPYEIYLPADGCKMLPMADDKAK